MKRTDLEIKRRFGIKPDSVMGMLIDYALQPTRFENLTRSKPALRRQQREAIKLARRFEHLVADAMAWRVTDEHLKIYSTGRTMRWLDLSTNPPIADAGRNKWHCSGLTPASVKFRAAAVEMLDAVIDGVKRERYEKPPAGYVMPRLTLKEMRDVAAMSGSRFFKELSLSAKDRIWVAGYNVVRIVYGASKRNHLYRFDAKDGQFHQITQIQLDAMQRESPVLVNSQTQTESVGSWQ